MNRQGFATTLDVLKRVFFDKGPVMYTNESEHDDVPKKFVESLENTLREIVEL